MHTVFIRIPNFLLSLTILKILLFKSKNILESFVNFSNFEH